MGLGAGIDTVNLETEYGTESVEEIVVFIYGYSGLLYRIGKGFYLTLGVQPGYANFVEADDGLFLADIDLGIRSVF